MKPTQLPLFPYRESIQQVVEEACQRLPITDRNEMVAILNTMQNTVIHLLESNDGKD